MKYLCLPVLLWLAGCGYSFSQKQITFADVDGKEVTAYSCGTYMRVSSESWSASTFEVTFTDSEDLAHDLYGVKEVVTADIPPTVNAPLWGFGYDYTPDQRYGDNADGTPGSLIKEGDIVVRGDSRARVVNGKWAPVKIANPACKKKQ